MMLPFILSVVVLLIVKKKKEAAVIKASPVTEHTEFKQTYSDSALTQIKQ
jgi:hypothetical protein